MGSTEVVRMTSSHIKWEFAYYPLSDRYITVEEALRVRERNSGEYRENPCYNSKKDFEEGLGIKLTPVNMNGKAVNYFRSYPGQFDVRKKITNSVGMGGSSSAQYTDNAIRVKSVIDILSNNLQKDKITIRDMLLGSAKDTGNVNSLSHPDIVIRHRGDYSRRETRIFVQDIGRKPEYQVLPDDWVLEMEKFGPDVVTSWKSIKPLFMKYWKAHEAKRGRYIERMENEEAKETLDDILFSLQMRLRKSVHSLDQLDLDEEIARRLKGGSISSNSVVDEIRRLFLLKKQPSTYVNGLGQRVPWYTIVTR